MKASRPHDELVVEMLKADPDMADVYLATALEEANLPVGPSQKLLQSIATGLNHIVAGRGEIAHTVRTLTAIKSGSSLQETSYNCPGETPPLLAAQEAETAAACPLPVFG